MTDTTIADWLAPQRVGFDVLHERYGPLLGLVEQLLGVVPNCDQYLEIWPPAFRTYNLVVPHFLNLPQMLVGLGAPRELTGLALYGSSLAAGCGYCSAHTCSFAQRRGAPPAAMTGDASPAEQAVLSLASSLGRVPHTLTTAEVDAVREHLSDKDTEWMAVAAAMMGFLNKFMDAVGVPLEEPAVADSHDLMSTAGWTPGVHFRDRDLPEPVRPPRDGLRTYLSVARSAPGAQLLDRRWQHGVPSGAGDGRAHLRERTGHDEPSLDRIGLTRPRRALTTMLRENLGSPQRRLDPRLKGAAALVLAEVLRSPSRADRALALARDGQGSLDPGVERTLRDLAHLPTPEDEAGVGRSLATLVGAGFDASAAALLVLARACAPSPAEVAPALVEHCAPHWQPAEVVELVTWLAVQQLLHRLEVFYDVRDASTPRP